jgi:long-chain acyl-CoA synthetase
MYEIEAWTIPELVAKTSRSHAGRPALAMIGKESVMYDELEARSRRVAAFLSLLGIRQGDRVAILSENRPEWGLAAFGASLGGSILVPILTDFSPEQIANILEHSEARLLFVSKRFLPKVEAERKRRILVAIEDLSMLSDHAAPAPGFVDAATMTFKEPAVSADDLAAIVYTSGTTGRSKGVMLTHRNIIYDAWACRRFIVLGRRDRLLSILPLAHTYEFTIGFIIPMMQGSAVYYLDRPPSATALLPAMKAVRPTVVLSVPLVMEKVYRSSVLPGLEAISLYKSPLFRPLLERVAGKKLMKAFGGKIRFFGLGGAPVAADVEAFLNRARFPYSIGYGLTETAPMVAGNKPGRVVVHTTGVAATGVEMRIADKRPDTGEGEIQVRGPNVTPGYYKDPERTKEIFTEDGWFRTGDLGFMDGKGRVTVRGRIKTMILGASGENIYPEEIEAVLNSSPYVLESLVYGDEAGLTALVQLKPEILAELEARVKDGIEGAEEKAHRLEHAVESGIEHAEAAAAHLLEKIRKDTNERLAAFSRLHKVKLQVEPFEKTPKQSIKRFLYPRHPAGKTKG